MSKLTEKEKGRFKVLEKKLQKAYAAGFFQDCKDDDSLLARMRSLLKDEAPVEHAILLANGCSLAINNRWDIYEWGTK